MHLSIKASLDAGLKARSTRSHQERNHWTPA